MLTCLILIYAVAVALKLPIYPDEIAYKIFIERYFLNGGYKQSLTPYCAAGFLARPPLLLLPASIFGSLLSLLGGDWWSYRLIPLICIFCITLLLIFNSLNKVKKAPWASLLILAITPCIYGLVILRPEIFILFGGLFFFLIACWFADNKSSIFSLLLISLLQIFFYSFLASIHPKSLYLLPLVFLSTVYASNSIDKVLIKIVFLLFFILLLLFITTSSIELHKIQFLACQEVPKIQNGMSRQSLNPLLLVADPLGFIRAIGDLFNLDLITRSISQLTFKNNFDSNYLPPVDDDSIFIKIINWLNVFIFISMLIGILFFTLMSWRFIPIKIYFIFLALTFAYLTPYFLNLNKNWYENSFLLGAIVIISSLYYPHLHKFNFLKGLNLKIKYFKIILKFIIFFAAIGTAIVTGIKFDSKFNGGFSGPGISIFLNRKSLDNTVSYLILKNSLGEQNGFIVDDLTYDSLKKVKVILPATYLSLVGEWPDIVNHSILSQEVEYGIARCTTLTLVNPALQWVAVDRVLDRNSGEEICLFRASMNKN